MFFWCVKLKLLIIYFAGSHSLPFVCIWVCISAWFCVKQPIVSVLGVSWMFEIRRAGFYSAGVGQWHHMASVLGWIPHASPYLSAHDPFSPWLFQKLTDVKNNSIGPNNFSQMPRLQWGLPKQLKSFHLKPLYKQMTAIMWYLYRLLECICMCWALTTSLYSLNRNIKDQLVVFWFWQLW